MPLCKALAHWNSPPHASPPPQMTGNQNFEGSMADALARLGLGVPQVSIYDDLFIFWSNRTCECWPLLCRALAVT